MKATQELILDSKVYSPSTTRLITSFFFPALSLAFSGFFLWIFCTSLPEDIVDSVPMLVGALLLPLLCLMVFYSSSSVRLVVNQDGILYLSVCYSIYTPWENIERIEQRWHGSRLVPSLILRSPASVVESMSKAILLKQCAVVITPWMSAIGIEPRTWEISFETFVNDWRRSKLGEDIRRYAPHLMQD